MEESVKLYMADQVPFSLGMSVSANYAVGGNGVYGCSNSICWKSVDIRAAVSGAALQLEQYAKLKEVFQNRQLSCEIRVQSFGRESARTTEFYFTFEGRDNPELSSCLKEVLGDDEAYLQAEMVDWQEYTRHGERYETLKEFTTKEMKLEWLADGNSLGCVDGTHNPVIYNLEPVGNVEPTQIVRGKMNLFLIVKDCVEPSEGQKMALYKRMLDEELATDAVIIPSNGAEVNCHRGILAMHSPVFQAMFGTDMMEAKTRKIEMPDLSEEGVRGFLAYLHHWDTSKAEESCTVAVELLKAGHKYNVRFLEKAMRKLLISKPEPWYDVDVAMKLFLFVWNLDAEWETLKKMAVMVLKKNSPELKNSPTVQQLFCETPQAAIAFCQYAISSSN